MRLRTLIAFFILAVFGAGLAACGGGSVSTGGGSGTGGTGGASSSIVVQSPRSAGLFDHQGTPRRATGLAAVFSDFLIRDAMAQDGEVEVSLYDAGSEELLQTGTTTGGQVAFAVEEGEYIVCFGTVTEEDDIQTADNCELVSVGEDEIAVVTYDSVEGQLTATGIELIRVEDEIVEDTDGPSSADKVFVCHNGMTLSVARPAALTGHTAHGDETKPCDDLTQVTTEGTDDEDSKGGPPDHAGRPDHAGPPDGNSEDT